MGLTAAELGLDMPGTINGKTEQEVHARGICACGHRVAKHRPGRRCEGVPIGRRLTATMEDTDCRCEAVVPIMTVADVRPFQASWSSVYPSHPFMAGLAAIGLEKVTGWLVEYPLVCLNPECPSAEAGEGGVRMRYLPGTGREVSAFMCEACYSEAYAAAGGI